MKLPRIRIGLGTLLLLSLLLASGGLLWLRWDPWQEVMRGPLMNSADTANSNMLWSPDGKRILFVWWKKTIPFANARLAKPPSDAIAIQSWNGATGQLEREWQAGLPMVFGSGYRSDVWFSSTGRWIGVQSTWKGWPATPALFEAETGALFTSRHINETCSILRFSPDDKTIVIRQAKRDLTQLLDVQTDTVVDLPEGIEQCIFSPDGKLIAAPLPLSAVLLYGIEKRDILWVKPLHSKAGKNIAMDIRSMEFSPDSKWLAASTSVPLETTVFELPGGKTHCKLLGATFNLRSPLREEAIFSKAFSPDSGRLTTVGGGTGMIWDVASGKQLREVQESMTGVEELQFSPDGKLVTALFTVWDANNGAPISTDTIHPMALTQRWRRAPDAVRKLDWASAGRREVCPALYRLRRPEEWYGFAWLPEFWLTLVFAAALLFHLAPWKTR